MSFSATVTGTDKAMIVDQLANKLSQVPPQPIGGVPDGFVTAVGALVGCIPLQPAGSKMTVTVDSVVQAGGSVWNVKVTTQRPGA